MKVPKVFGPIIVITCVLVLLSGCAPTATSNEIKLGAGQDLTGSGAAIGKWAKCAQELAADDINAAGGINGKKVVIQFEDDRFDPKEAASIAQKFVDDTKVVAMTGYATSTNVLAALPITDKAKLLLLSWGNTSPKLANHESFYRIVVDDSVFGRMLGHYAVEKLGKKNIAVMYADSDATVANADAFKLGVTEAGGTIAAWEMHKTDDKDYLATLTKIRNLNPDLIYLPTWYGNAALIARQAKELDIKVDFMGQDSVYNPEIVALGGDAIEGMWAGGFFHPDQNAGAQKFAAAYKAKCGFEAEGYSANAYDTIMLIKQAIEKNGATREGVLSYMATVTDANPFKGVSGDVAFQASHDCNKTAVMVRVENGRWVFKDNINPVK